MKAREVRKEAEREGAVVTRDQLTAYLSGLDDVTHERVANLIACYRAMPAGFDALVRVLQHGSKKHNDAPVLWRMVVPQ